jgi:DNA-binding ferritin-like protein
MPTTNSEIAEAVRDLTHKVDAFIQSIPTTYVSHIENDRRFGTLEGMYHALKAEFVAFQERYRQDSLLNTSAHDNVNNAMVESERRIIEKIENMTHTTWGARLTILLGAFGWILTLGLVVIDLMTRR